MGPIQKRPRPQQLTLCRSLHAEALQAAASEGLAQGPYVEARAGFEPMILRSKGIDSTNAPPCSTIKERLPKVPYQFSGHRQPMVATKADLLSGLGLISSASPSGAAPNRAKMIPACEFIPTAVTTILPLPSIT